MKSYMKNTKLTFPALQKLPPRHPTKKMMCQVPKKTAYYN